MDFHIQGWYCHVWITHIVTWSGPAHRSQASMRGAATRGRKTDLGGLRCGDLPGVTMWVIHTPLTDPGCESSSSRSYECIGDLRICWRFWNSPEAFLIQKSHMIVKYIERSRY